MSDLFAERTTEAPPHEPEPAPEALAHERREQRRARDLRRKRRRRRSLVVLTLAVVLVGALALWAVPKVREALSGVGSSMSAQDEDYPGPGSGEVQVDIPEGATGAEMGEVLEEAGVVASVGAFTDAFGANAEAASIQPGTYTLMSEMKAADAVAALLDPASRAEVTVTVPEGFHASQVYERIANVAGIPLEEVKAAAADAAAIGLPPEAGGNPEGWFAAATYTFEPDDDATAMLSEMVALTVSRLDELGVPADQRQAVLTKASIVEREVNLPEYYGQVARVIENRLVDTGQVNGRLQMDSTVLYGVGKSGGVPTQADLDQDTPYNTYLHAGLPPTPIGAPGEAVVEAVVNAPEGPWLYFATVNLDTGETKFAATLEEHNANVAELRAWLEANPQD